MYAIVEIAGQQLKVEKDQQLFVHRLEAKEGDKVTFDKVLLIDNKGKVNVGAPAITGANVSVKILEHLKGDKVIVFKKKRRKGYKVKNGHRQYLTKIQVEGISEKGGAKPAANKEATPKKAASEAPKAAAKKVETAPKAAVAKKAPAKKVSTDKAPAKKAPAKKTETAPKAEVKKTTKKSDDSDK